MNILRICTVTAIAVLIFGRVAFAFSEGTLPVEGKTDSAMSDTLRVSVSVPVMSPLFEKVPIAKVNDEVVTLKELSDALVSSHEGRTAGGKQAARIDFSTILKRLINVRLIVQEAREMGMDELPEVKDALKRNNEATMRELLIEDITKDVKADEAEADKLRREMVREWKIKSVFFEKEDDAKKMEEAVKAGKNFDELVAKAIEDKTAKGRGEGGYVKPKDLLPDVAKVISEMKVGDVSTVIKIGSGDKAGFTIMKLEEIRYPEDPETTERARGAVLDVARAVALKNFKGEAYKKTVKINNKLLDSLDFEAKEPGLEKMLKDTRNVATVEGEKPVTVADLSKAVSDKFFHGLQRAAESKQVNTKKREILDNMLEKRLFEKEELKRGIKDTEKFKIKMKEYEDSVLFSLFVQRVLMPEVKTTEEDLKAYFKDHAGDYTTPEMMKVSSLVFETKEKAEGALDRLKKGADFNWMKSNTEGQLDSSKSDVISFPGTTLVTKNLPEGVRNALSGAKSEEYRLYQSPEGYFYVLYVRDVVPSALQQFEEVREEIKKKVFNEKLNASVGEWADKLRVAADVKVYLSSSGEPVKGPENTD
jgi:parvulin-like peptidyl-prolyl isomerase